jgi:uncharacterized membrane protein (UPF0127 family)
VTPPRLALHVPLSARVLATASVIALTGCSAPAEGETGAVPDSPAAVVPDGPAVVVGDLAPIAVEVADDDAERRVGLMGRAEVPPGTGMLFVYDEPVTNAFWMGNVEVPLSIAWVLGDEVVGVAEMQPCPAADASCPRYSPGGEFDRAVETSAGTFSEAGVVPGDPVTVDGIG